MRQPRFSKEEFARRGNDIYERDLRPVLESANQGQIVAIDIESGAFALGDDTLAAARSLLARQPNAQIWVLRIGHPGVHRFGPRAAATQS